MSRSHRNQSTELHSKSVEKPQQLDLSFMLQQYSHFSLFINSIVSVSKYGENCRSVYTFFQNQLTKYQHFRLRLPLAFAIILIELTISLKSHRKNSSLLNSVDGVGSVGSWVVLVKFQRGWHGSIKFSSGSKKWVAWD